MHNKLPIVSTLIGFFVISFVFLTLVKNVSAVAAPTATLAPSPTPVDATTGWVKDQEVTFVGKTATRSNDFLEWTLFNYNWSNIPYGAKNPIQDFWFLVATQIVAPILLLFIIGSAFVMIATRGQNLTIMRFVPRFIFVVILIVFSFALIRFIYQIVDIFQGFFLTIKDLGDPTKTKLIGPKDLLYIAFNYETFTGFRKVGIDFDESAFISLLLVKLTAITYYVMTGLLLIRKIILWFFIIVSPIFPLLLFFRPARNTAKIWVGEFFRWLLYAPLFALFLHGLVNVWRSGIPMNFDFTKVGTQVYPTAINILLGGPGQQIGIENSVNLRDTFALYVVALLMLWVVILLPFLLLQIFLDYLNNVSIGENPVVRKIANNSWFSKVYGGTPPPTPPGQPPSQPSPYGLAKSLPFFNKRAMDMPQGRGVGAVSSSTNISNMYSNSSTTNNNSNVSSSALGSTNISSLQSVKETKEVLKMANLSVPKMRDIARYETSMTRHDVASRTEVSSFHDTLEKISKPNIVAAPHDREKFTTIKEKLTTSQKQGDPLATSVLNASKVTTKSTQIVKENSVSTVREVLKGLASPDTITSPSEKTRITQIKQELVAEKDKGNTMAATILEASEKVNNTSISEQEKTTLVEKSVEALHESAKKGNKLAESIMTNKGEVQGQVHLPTVNKVQQVSIEEYEDVKKMWVDNYQKMDTPIGPSGTPMDKHTFIQQDTENITETINLLSSQSQENVDKGMDRVANILPFLLLGGFSKTEVVSYLKAKLEAGKTVLSSTEDKKEEDDTLLDRTPADKQAHGEMVMRADLPVEEEKAANMDISSDKKLPNDDEKDEPGTPSGIGK